MTRTYSSDLRAGECGKRAPFGNLDGAFFSVVASSVINGSVTGGLTDERCRALFAVIAARFLSPRRLVARPDRGRSDNMHKRAGPRCADAASRSAWQSLLVVVAI